MHRRGFNQIIGIAALLTLGGLAAGQNTPAAGAPKATAPAETPKPADDGKDPTVKRDVSNYNLGKAGLAIDGYDPVAYYPEGGGKPAKGDAKFTYVYRGATYRFANQKNLDAFKVDPRKYEPAHGGWCSSAMADGGRKVEIDPTNYKITKGRLFLFYKSFFQNALTYWNQDEPAHTVEADDHWKIIASEEPRMPK